MSYFQTIPIMCVSRKGTGRAAVLSVASLVYNRLLQGHFTPIATVALALRDQRAGVFENITQYKFLYMAVASYIKTRTGEPKWDKALSLIHI